MKTRRNFDTGLILLSIFLISTLILIVTNSFKLVSDSTIFFIVNIWEVELGMVIGYGIIFYDAKQSIKNRRTSLIS